MHKLANSAHVTFQVAGVEQDILRFDVEMRDFPSVQVVEGLEDFSEASFGRLFGKGNFFVENRLQFTSSRPKKVTTTAKINQNLSTSICPLNLHLKN